MSKSSLFHKLLNIYNKFIVYIIFPLAFITLLTLAVIFSAQHKEKVNYNKQAAIIKTAFQIKEQAKPNRLDCSAYTQTVYKQHNIFLPRSSAQQFYSGIKIDSSELEPGDLVFFKVYGNRISHVGIVIDSTSFIHANTSKGITINSWSEPYWSKRLVGFVSPQAE